MIFSTGYKIALNEPKDKPFMFTSSFQIRPGTETNIAMIASKYTMTNAAISRYV